MTSKNRQSRKAAKEVPSRKSSRVYSARHDVLNAAEDLSARMRNSHLPSAILSELNAAKRFVEKTVRDVKADTPSARATLNEASAAISHLSLAHSWLTNAERLLESLTGTEHALRHDLTEAVDQVRKLLRADDLGGSLVSAVRTLEDVVADAATRNAKVA